MKFLKLGFVLMALTLFIIACAENKQANNTLPSNTISVSNNNSSANANITNINAQQGAKMDETASVKKIYMEKCVRCHKEDGTGGKVEIEGTTINAENFTADKMKNMTDVKYIGYIENGVPDEGMPAFKGKLTDDEIKNLVKFIRSEFQGK
ncbi:MAG: cytochrome c [Acidobacteriota bacterium]|nr:cytochrome c [Acidobacteriota bacterium]